MELERGSDLVERGAHGRHSRSSPSREEERADWKEPLSVTVSYDFGSDDESDSDVVQPVAKADDGAACLELNLSADLKFVMMVN